jgi:predicted Zn-dependent protease
MQRARCGNPDLGTVNSIRRPINVDITEPARLNQARSINSDAPQSYVTHTNIWTKKHLKWSIEEYPKQQTKVTSHQHLRDIIKQAFHDWEKYSGLRFEMAKNKEKSDLKIKFHSNDHGDGFPFDGKGSTLAHAFYPTSGEIHFDDDEHFTDSYDTKDEEYNLRLVAAHEIGHALGLSHSFEEDSLMFPVYQSFPSNFTLSVDDQQGIQVLYDKPDETTQVTSSETTVSPQSSTHSSIETPMHNWCADDFQTGCEGPDGELYLFKDDQVWRYQTRTKRHWDYRPTSISERFPALSNATITACVKSSIGYTYLFRNYRMWKIKTHWSIDGPNIIQSKHYPQNPRVALRHQNSIYLIRHRLIYRLHEFDYERELDIHTLDSILNPPPDDFIYAGFTFAKRHYIFTQNQVYVYDSTDGHLLSGYPKSRVNGWFAGESTSKVSSWHRKNSEAKHEKKNNEHRRSHHPNSKRPFHRHRDD